MGERLEEVGKLIAEVNAAYAKAAEAFRQLAHVQVKSEAMLGQYLAALFPRSRAQEHAFATPPKWEVVKRLFETREDLQLPGVRGTWWGAYNAVTAFEDYRKARDETADKRLDRVWFGRGADLKLRALDKALEMAKAA